MRVVGYVLLGLAAFAGAFVAVRDRAPQVDPEARRIIAELDARLDRASLADLVGLEDRALVAMERWPELARSFRVRGAEAAARRYLEFGEARADLRAAARWAEAADSDRDRGEVPWLALAVAARTSTAAAALEARLDSALASPSAPALEARALLHARAGRLGPALADLSAAVDRAPARGGTRRHLGRLLAARGALASAAEVFARSADVVSGALHGYAAARAAGQRVDLPILPAGPHPFERGRRALLEAVELGLDDPSRIDSTAAAAAYPDRPGYRRTLGDLALLWGRFREARAHYEEALRLAPEAMDAEVGLARIRLATKLGRCSSDRPARLGEVRFDPARFELVTVAFDPRVFPEHRYAALRSESPGERARGFGVANRVALAEQCLADDHAVRAARYLGQAAERREGWVPPELRARALLSAGRPRSALRLAQSETPSPMMSVIEARALARLGDLESARRRLQPVATSTQALVPSAIALAAKWALEADDLVAAEAFLERLERLAPDRLEVQILKLEHALRAGTEATESARWIASEVDPEDGSLIEGMPFRVAWALQEVTDRPKLRLALLERAAADPEAPDAVRLRLARQRLENPRARGRGRRLLRRLLRSDDVEIRREARRLLRR